MGALLLFVLLIGNLARLLREYRTNVPGARLKARMVGMFVGLAVLPLLVVFYFSYQFINRGIDTWFNVEVEEGLDNALKLSRAVLEIQKREHLYATQGRWRRLSRNGQRTAAHLRAEHAAARERRERDDAVRRNAQIIATSSDSAPRSLPKPLTEEVILQMQQNRPFVSLDPLEAVATRSAPRWCSRIARSCGAGGVIQAYFPVTERLGRMTNSVETSYCSDTSSSCSCANR